MLNLPKLQNASLTLLQVFSLVKDVSESITILSHRMFGDGSAILPGHFDLLYGAHTCIDHA